MVSISSSHWEAPVNKSFFQSVRLSPSVQCIRLSVFCHTYACVCLLLRLHRWSENSEFIKKSPSSLQFHSWQRGSKVMTAVSRIATSLICSMLTSQYWHGNNAALLLHVQFPVAMKNGFNLYFLAEAYLKEQQEQRLRYVTVDKRELC